ncbi:MAG: tRNA pseudouridine(38-40) synthase TruA [candidate division WOR-3 bacterium]
MENVKIVLEYDGTDFYGWQVQPGKRTVQGELEKALLKIFGEKIKVIGSGRTDKGVHALGQVASFFCPQSFDPEELKNALNGNIGRDIFVKECELMPETFNARFSAKSRVYRYQITTEKSVFTRRYFFYIKETLNLENMEKAKEALLGWHNFENLSTKDSGFCELRRLEIQREGKNIFIEVEADRFLRRMVRGIVGLLIAVGEGKIEPEDAEKIIEGQRRRLPIVPPFGLFLLEVKY